jgi:predicted nucleic acid-binding protein
MFWDASALVPVILAEARSKEMAALLVQDTAPAIWWASPVECASAICRRHRDNGISTAERDEGMERLREILPGCLIVPASGPVRERALRLLVSHALRSADAQQLAAALIWCEEKPA